MFLHAFTSKDGSGREVWEGGGGSWRGGSVWLWPPDEEDTLEEWRRWWVWVWLLSS